MKCPKCQYDNPDTQKYCGECGCPLSSSSTPSRTLSFDEKIEIIQRYLPKGLTEKILSQRDKIEGERKQVTVMFCDMEGFTPLVEKLGPEKAYSIMDKVYEILIHRVRNFDGTVNEMTGDGIMALFGAPIALEDAPQRALRSALAIHSEITRFNRQREGMDPVKMRIGIHTGPVIVGTLGSDLRVEFKAVGDTVNLASRMEGLAEPGTTYVTRDTFRLTEGLFRFEAAGEKSVKGKERTVMVYKLLFAKKDVHRPRLGVERSIYSEMVGRDKELNRLELQVMKAINGEGSVVNIIGEAGVGKSRLVAELKKKEIMKRITLLEGSAISIGRNLSFHPIIDLLKQWARIIEEDSEAVALSKLEAAVEKVHPEEIYDVVPFVATIMGMKLSGRYAERVKGIEGEALEKLIIKNGRGLLNRVTELGPLMIVTEDLHWADNSSIELMESLMRLAETQRIIFVNVFRPGYKETGDRIIKAIKERLPIYYVEIVLPPLDERMSEKMIDNMLKIRSLSHYVRDQIIERAAGNPFFIEEVVRSFIDEGVVILKDGRFKVTEKIETVIIPHTIGDVLMARIDRLEDKTRSLVKVASVIGRNFFYKILLDVVKTIDDIDHRLSYLKEIQLIKERKRLEELEYLFKHALAQEVAYQSILNQRRKELHLRVADSIERVFREKLSFFYGILAYHYSQGENLDKAEEYLIKAGKEALRSSASSEALNYYQQGLRLYLKKYGKAADPEKLAAFEKNIALAFFNKGQYENAVKYFDTVLGRWGEKPPKNRFNMGVNLLFNLLSVIANLYLPIRRAGKAPNKRENEIFDLCYKRAITLVYINPKRCFFEYIKTIKGLNRFDIGKVENGIGMWMSGSGLFSWTGISFRLSRRMLDYKKEAIKKNDIKDVLYYELFALLYNAFTGNWSDIKEYDEDLVARNLKIGEAWHVSTYLLFHGFINIGQGAYKESELKIGRLLEISKDYGNENGTDYWYTLKILKLITLRKLHAAQKEMDEGISFLGQTGRETGIVHYLGLKALIQVRLKDFEGADDTLERTRDLGAKQLSVPPIYASSSLLAEFLSDLHFLEQASLSYDKSNLRKYKKRAYQSGRRALKNSNKYAFDRTEIIRSMGLYFWLIDKRKRAMWFWNRGIKEAERLGARVELARTYMEMGKRLFQVRHEYLKKNAIMADGHLEKAKDLFQEMGHIREMEEIEKIIECG